MKIVTYAGSVIWNENHPALKQYGDDCLAFRHGSAAELIEQVGDDRDVLVLTDNDPASFELYDTLTDVFRSRRIHLFVCLPFTYESSRRKREILARLEKLEMAKSLCLVELDSFLAGTDAGETLGSLQLRIRNSMIVLLEQAIAAMRDMDEFSQYRYDFGSGRYVPADLSGVAEEFTKRPAAGKKAGAVCAAEEEILLTEEQNGEPVPAETEPVPAEEKTSVTGETAPDKQAAELKTEMTEIPSEEGKNDLTAGEEEPADGSENRIQDKGTDTPAGKTRRSIFSFLRRKRD